MSSSPTSLTPPAPSVRTVAAAGASPGRFAMWLTLAFVVLGGVVTLRHEFWRDEIQSWLLARDSSGVLDLFSRQRYEGHPALWQVLLLPLTRGFSSPVAMQVLHLVIAAATVFLFARSAPFTRLQKLLFSFGYFPFYEYNVISRSYALGLLLLTSFCVLFPQRRRRFLTLATLLVLLCHTHALTLIIAVVLAAGLAGEFLSTRHRGASGGGYESKTVVFGLTLFVVGAATALWQIVPPSDSGVAVGWTFDPGLGAILGAGRNLTAAYLPQPAWDSNFWNHPALFERPYGPLTWMGSALVAIFAGWVAFRLARRPFAGWVFVAGSGALLVFFHVKYAGFARHHGMLFVVLVVAVWLSRIPPADASGRAGEGRSGRTFDASLTLLLGLHAVAGGLAAAAEVSKPFSNAGAVAAFLQRETRADDLLVGHVDYTTVAILAGSPQRQIFYPQAGRSGSYIIWDQRRLTRVTVSEVVAAARALPRRMGQRVILILNYRPGEALLSRHGLRPRAEFTGAVVEDENFFLYELEPSS